MRIVFARQAERDFEEIGDRIADDNPDRATTFVIELREACLALSAFPQRYPVARSVARRDVRRRNYRDYAVLYRVDDAHVTILRVMHGARDIGADDSL